MKSIVITILLFPAVVLAANIYVTEISSPYSIVPIVDEIDEPQLHLGTLENFPVMYEFLLGEQTNFRARVSQPISSSVDSPSTISILLVRKDDQGGGVTEVARLTSGIDGWSIIEDSSVGASFWQSEYVETSLESGAYRVEVSAPDNQGKYLLNFGPNEDYGYFTSLSRAWTIQQFLGYSPLKILTSNLIYYPLGILFVAFLLNRTWKYRKIISNVN